MKKHIIKKLSFILSLSLMIGLSPSLVKADTLSTPQTNLTEGNIAELSDTEFDNFLMDYVTSEQKSGKSFNAIKEELDFVGVDIEKSSVDYNPDTSTRYIAPSTATLSSYTAKRTGDSYYRVYGQVTHNATEWYPGSLDLLSIEWDYSKATYYSTATDGTFTTYMDGSQKAKGICLFNVEDQTMYAGDYAYAVVYVIPKSSNSTIAIGTKYIHTYNKTNISWAVGVNLGYTEKGPTGGYSFNLTGTTVTDNWQLYDDNDIYN